MPKLKSTDIPTIKPWCFRVTRTGAKKYGARENWPLEQRHELTSARKAKRAKRGDPSDEELRLRIVAKLGGIDGKIARLKLRATKQEKHHKAEDLRRDIAERLKKLFKGRASVPSPGESTSSANPKTKKATLVRRP